MAGNAHASRHRKAKPCSSGCVYCKTRPKFGTYANKTGHRRNPARKHGGRRRKATNVV